MDVLDAQGGRASLAAKGTAGVGLKGAAECSALMAQARQLPTSCLRVGFVTWCPWWRAPALSVESASSQDSPSGTRLEATEAEEQLSVESASSQQSPSGTRLEAAEEDEKLPEPAT